MPIYGSRFTNITDAYLTSGFSSAEVSRWASSMWRPEMSTTVASWQVIASAVR